MPKPRARTAKGGPITRFNRICLALAALWLLVSVPVGILLRPTIPDFSQFYMGGLIARLGEWDALYPIPLPHGLDNPGLFFHSIAKPRWTLLSRRHEVPDYTRFILPPPSALVFVPLSFLSFSQAFWVWTFFLAGCAWGVAATAGVLCRKVFARPSRLEGALALLIGVSPMTARAIRIANVTPAIALAIGLALLCLLERDRNAAARGAVAILAGALLKYATLVLAPLLLAMRRWRMLTWLAALGSLVVGLTWAIAGSAPFEEFYRGILPTLNRPSWFYGNQSLPGLISRIWGRPFPFRIAFALRMAQIFMIELTAYLLLTLRQERWRDPVNVLAGASLLLSWLLVFSPIAWEHWPILLCPAWGWILWEAREGGVTGIQAAISLALMYFPAGIIQVPGIATYPVVLPEPYNSTQLAGVILLMLLSSWRLVRARKEPIPVAVFQGDRSSITERPGRWLPAESRKRLAG